MLLNFDYRMAFKGREPQNFPLRCWMNYVFPVCIRGRYSYPCKGFDALFLVSNKTLLIILLQIFVYLDFCNSKLNMAKELTPPHGATLKKSCCSLLLKWVESWLCFYSRQGLLVHTRNLSAQYFRTLLSILSAFIMPFSFYCSFYLPSFHLYLRWFQTKASKPKTIVCSIYLPSFSLSKIFCAVRIKVTKNRDIY